jgi:zinc transport system permease protein
MSLWNQGLAALPFEWAQFAFMQNALLAVVLVAPLFALLGCMVISTQMTFFSEAIGHASLTGIALGVLLGLGDPLWAMIGFALLLALAVTLLRRRSAASTDAIIGLVMAVAVAAGVVLLSRGGGFNKYSRYLIGDLLTVGAPELQRMAWVLALFCAVWIAFYNHIFLVGLNRSLARSRGEPVWLIETLFAALVGVAVAVAIPWVGLLVINSLLILPAATARNLAANTRQFAWWAILAGLAAGVGGLIGSYYWATATGATVVLFAAALYLLSLAARRR